MRLQLQQLSRKQLIKLTTQDIMDIYNAAAHSVDSDIFYTASDSSSTYAFQDLQ